MSDANVMQAQLGLSGSGGSMSPQPFGYPTPMPVPPPMKHPGDAARDAVQMTQTMAMNTMQSAQAVNYASMGTPGGGFGGGGGMGGGGGGWGMGSFANQYRQNMAGIQQQQLNPWMAGSMAQIMGSGGYQAGMMPSPIQMTQPSMGIYRPPPQMPMGQIPPVPQMPMFPTPFTPNMPSPMFSTPFDYNMQRGEVRGVQNTAAALSIPGVAARGATAAAGGWAGAGLGANLGARFGAGGAAIGSAVGGFAGMVGAEHFLGAGVQNLADQMNPFDRMARHTAQIRGVSQEFVVGGSGLSAGGRGFSVGASAHVGRQLNNLAADSGFQRQTGSQFSSQDLMKITQTSGQQGLLDMAQNPEQMVGQVKNIAKALTAFMKLAGEPDVQEALKQLGQMKQMGLSLGESMSTMQNAKMFSRMAGTSVQGIMQSGLSGAMTFQQQGLSAGLGLNVGMGAMGMARQAVAGGSFTDQQLSRYGGVQGVAQMQMESSLATLKQPLMAAAMTTIGAGGTFGLDPAAMKQLGAGKLGPTQMATMGVNNLNAAVGKHGLGALATFQADQNKIADDIGKALGPLRVGLLPAKMAMSNMRMLGLQGQGRGGLLAGLAAAGVPEGQASAQADMMGSPEYWHNLQLSSNKGRMEDRAEEYARRKRDAPSLLDHAMGRSSTVRGLAHGADSIGVGADELLEGISAGMANSGAESAANKSGQTRIRTSDDLFASSPEEARRIRAMGARKIDEEMPASSGLGGSAALFRTPGGRAIGRSSAVASVRSFLGGDSYSLQQHRERQGGLRGALGGGALETVARLTPVGLVAGALGITASGEEVTAAQKKEAGVAESINAGLNASAVDQSTSDTAITGKFGDKASAMRNAYSESLAASAREKASIFGGGKLGSADTEKALAAARAAGGASEADMAGMETHFKTAGMQDAQLKAGKANVGAFEVNASLNKDEIVGTIDDIKDRRTARGEGRMGSSSNMGSGALTGAVAGLALGPLGALVGGAIGGAVGGLMTLGDAKKQSAAMDVLYGGDEDIGLLVALMAAVAEDGDDKEAVAALNAEQNKAKYKTPKGAQKIKDARAKLAANPKLQAQLASAGKSYGSEKDAAGAFSKDAVESRRDKQDIQTGSGKRAMFKDSSLVDLQQMSEHGILQTLSKDEGKRAKVDPELAKMAVQYSKADAKGKQKIADELAGMEMDKSAATPEELMGGALGKDEAKRDAESDDIAATAGDALSQFPAAVQTFSEASKALQVAAEHLGKATKMGDSVNFSIF